MRIFQQIGFVVLVIFLAGCSGNIVLDNPRDESVTFLFSGNTEYELGPNESKTISLGAGEYKIEVKSQDGTVLADTTFKLKDEDEGIVHSGASNYLVWRQLYGAQQDRETLLNEHWVEFDSMRAFGDIKVYPASWLYIQKNWDYGLDDELPDSKSLYITSDFAIETKVFRSKDFIETYRKLAKGE